MSEKNGSENALSKWERVPPGDLRPGTIVLQYKDESERFVGVIVGDHMIDGVKSIDRKLLKSFREKYHICLVLGHFSDFDERERPMLTEKKSFLFPCYSVGAIKTATPTDLKEEIELLKTLSSEKTCRGLWNTKLRQQMFMFPQKTREAISAVALVQHYMSGGSVKDIPEWLCFSHDNAVHVFAELYKAIPYL